MRSFGSKQHQHKIVIKDNRTGNWIHASLLRFQKHHAQMWKVQWSKRLKRKDGAVYPDAHWDWSSIFSDVFKSAKHEGYCVLYDQQLQGFLALLKCGKLSKSGNPVLFVEFLATAPWNRPNNTITSDGIGKLSAIGISMLAYAVARSKELGYKGRIALESEIEAIGFYERIGMSNKGTDADGTVWFEFTEKAAERFLLKYEERLKNSVKT